MNKIIAALIASAVLVMPVIAQQTGPADKGTQATQNLPNPAEFDSRMAQIQENMKKMQEQMSRIQQTQDPQRASAPLARTLDDHARVNGHDERHVGPRHDGRCYGSGECPRRRRSDDARSDGWTDDGRTDDGLVQHRQLLLEADARANEAASVHDGPVHGDAADDDGSHAAAATVDDAAASRSANDVVPSNMCKAPISALEMRRSPSTGQALPGSPAWRDSASRETSFVQEHRVRYD